MRKKIDKRGRKLIDYDKERHAIQQMQGSAGRNEAKFARQKEAMETAKRTYEILNSELHDELPALYDSRSELQETHNLLHCSLKTTIYFYS